MSLTIRRARPDEAGLVLSLSVSLPSMKTCCTKSRPPKRRSATPCSAAIRGCSARSRSGTASLPASRCGSSISPPSAAVPESIWRPCFVRPALRGNGIGKALLANLAQRCVANGWSRLQWAVLDWNTPSIEFYKSLGAVLMDEWTVCRVGGPALTALAQGTS